MPAHLGQHFLASPGHRARIVEALRLRGSECVLEIGPGKGAITDLLLERARRVMAVEVDPILASLLRRRYADNPKFEVIEGDILQVAIPPEVKHVVGNLPYYITSPIMMRLFQHAAQFEQMVVMVQLEVAERITADLGSREYGLLSVTTRYYGTPKLMFTIPPGAFQPRPRVESAVIRIEMKPRAIENEDAFFRMVKASFSQKRKTLVNNLKSLYGVDRAKAAIEKSGLSGATRAEEMTLDQFLNLFPQLVPSEAGSPK